VNGITLADRATVATARGLTRRRLLRNVGGMALGATVATAYAGRRPAAASHCAASSYSGPCGPAPLCGSSRCDGGGSSCNAANGVTFARWESGQAPCDKPDGSLYRNCWCEGSTRCCDCCVYHPGCRDYRCIGTWCGADDWKCICRGTSSAC
jgi:hypothetical protein